MTATLGPMVVIYQGFLQPKKYYVQGTSSQRSSKIVYQQSRSATLAKYFHEKCAHIRLPFTKWGIDFTTCNPPSAAGHHYIIVAMDYFMKWTILRKQRYFCSIMLSLGLVYPNPSSRIMAHTFVTP
jgi:hypothetical protein